MRASYKSFAGRIVNELDIERTRAPQGSAFRWKKRNEEQDGQRRQLAELRNLAGKGRKRRKGGGEGGEGGGRERKLDSNNCFLGLQHMQNGQCGCSAARGLENAIQRLKKLLEA